MQPKPPAPTDERSLHKRYHRASVNLSTIAFKKSLQRSASDLDGILTASGRRRRRFAFVYRVVGRLRSSQYVVVDELSAAVLPDVGAVSTGHTSCTKPVQNQKNARGSKLDMGCRFYTMATCVFSGLFVETCSTLARDTVLAA